MKKKLLNSMRVLLVAAGLCTGVNGAWASETTTTYTFEDENAVFTGRSRVTVAIVDDATLNSKVVQFTNANNTQNGYAFADYNFSSLVNKASTVTVNFDCYIGTGDRGRITIGDALVRGTTGGSAKNTSSTTGAIFTIGMNKDNAVLNSTTNLAKATYGDKWLNINIVVDVANKKYTYTIKQKSDDSVIKTESDIDYLANDANACSQIDVFGYINNAVGAKIDNLSITNYVDESVKYAGYTIKYIYGGTEIKTAVTDRAEIQVGEYATLLASDKEAITYNGQKYIYESDDASTQVIKEDGTTVVTVTFREAASYTYSIKAKYGDTVLETLSSGSVFEGDQVSTVQQLYYLVDNVLVKNNNNGGSDYTHKFTPDGNNYEGIITYAEDKEDVVFFAEAEDIPTLTPITSGYLATRFSGNQGAYAKDEAQVITTLAPGKYKLTAHILGTQSVATFTFKAGSETIWENSTSSGSFYVGVGTTGDEFTITKSTDITLEAAGGDGSSARVTNAVDFVYIQKTGDATEISATVTSAGWATLYTPYALDFSGVTGIEAYAATCSESTVTLTKVNSVPAGTGVVLKGAANTYSIPVIASSETDKGHLLGSATEATAYNAYDGYTLYMLKMVSGNAQFVPMTSGSLAAGKAYLKIASGNSSLARSLNVVFADEATGIQTVQSEGVAVDGYFNLSGQRVSQPTKGLYIVNGKKILVNDKR